MHKYTGILAGFAFSMVLINTFAPAFSESQAFQVESKAFQNGGKIPQVYTCKGQNYNPPLEISNVPANTKSLALVLEDPDAPLGTWQHWVAWNLPANTTAIPEDAALKNAVKGKNSSGRTNYDAPCPPFGTHRYYFHVYALDAALDLKAGSKRSDLDKAMKGHVLSTATLMGQYKK